MLKFKAVLLTVLLLYSGTVPVLAQQQTNASPKTKIRKQQTKMHKQLEIFNTFARKIDKKLHSARENGNSLTELEVLRALDAEYSAQKDPEIQEMMASLLMEKTGELGNYAKALEYADLGADKSAPAEPSAISVLKNYEPIDALEAISSMAEDHQIILINEAHHVPQHRALTLLMLKALRPKGFTYFAAETLFEGDTLLNERGYPIKTTGFYTNEPIYGDLIRTALKLGYHVVPYEWAHPVNYDVDKRERGQAKNLIDRILKENPDAKIVVHAGYNHINETGTLAGAKTMAQRLKEMTDIDPLTIDQTVMTEHSSLAYEHPLYRYVLNKKSISQPSLLRSAKGEWWTLEQGKWDVTLFHPRSVYEGGRPTWLRLGQSRTPYEIPANICKSTARCLVRVLVADEFDDAVPIDQVEVIAGRDIPVLMLPSGEFVLEIKDITDKMLKTSRIKIQ